MPNIQYEPDGAWNFILTTPLKFLKKQRTEAQVHGIWDIVNHTEAQSHWFTVLRKGSRVTAASSKEGRTSQEEGSQREVSQIPCINSAQISGQLLNNVAQDKFQSVQISLEEPNWNFSYHSLQKRLNFQSELSQTGKTKEINTFKNK